MKESEGRPLYNCSVCGKEASQVFLLLAGPVGKVCNECITSGMEALTAEVNRQITTKGNTDE